MVKQSYIPNVFKYFNDNDKIEINGKTYMKKDNPKIIMMNEYYANSITEPEELFEIDCTGIDKNAYTQEEIDDMIRERRQP